MANFEIDNQQGVAIIWMDQENSPVNKISTDVMTDFVSMLDRIESDNDITSAVFISRKKDFLVGADINMFGQLKEEEMLPTTMEGHAMSTRMVNMKKPFIAAIHGACMGAGTEIALCCDARVIASSKRTMMALPEVQLGLLPGMGGTQRLPRLIGIQKALDIMLTGKNIYASKAYKIGLADRIAPEESLLLAAKKMALDLVAGKFTRKDKRALQEKLLEGNPITRNIIYKKAKELVLKQTYGNYPAPINILKAVEFGMGTTLQKGLAREAELFVELMKTPESKQLINVFFGMTALKKNPMKDQAVPINKAAILGAGFMGEGIAEVTITKGIDIILKDISEETLSSAKASLWKSFSKKVKRKSLNKVKAEAILNRITTQLDYHQFEQADIVIEAVFEDLSLKQKIIAEVEAVTNDKCIFATNTSALPVTAIAQHAKRPENVIGMHYFSPVPKMPLLEIVITDQTADWVTATALAIGVKQGKTCIVVKDKPGFYTTRILAPYLNEALLLLEEGGDIQQIDRAMKKWGFPVGPITLLDEVGIDVGAHVQEGDLRDMIHKRFKEAGFPMEVVKLQTSDVMGKLAADGYKGRKNNKGFFQYDEKGKKKKGVVNEAIYSYFGGKDRKKMEDANIQERMGLIMVNEAVRCLEEEVLRNPLEGDIGAIFGLGFRPFSGGPFRYIDARGAADIVSKLDELKEKNGARFTACDMLVDYAKSGKLFHKNEN